MCGDNKEIFVLSFVRRERERWSKENVHNRTQCMPKRILKNPTQTLTRFSEVPTKEKLVLF